MSLILKGYEIEGLADGYQKITSYYDNAGTIVVQEVITAPERSNLNTVTLDQDSFISVTKQSSGSRQSYDFVKTINNLELFNDGSPRDTTIWRTIDDYIDDEDVFCSAQIDARASQTETWRLGIENPDDGTATGRITHADNRFFADIEVDCYLQNDTDGSIGIGRLSAKGGVCVQIGFNLASGDVSRDFQVHDGTSVSTYDISPGTGLLTCSGRDCRTVLAGDLTYTGANGETFAQAYVQMIKNALSNAGYKFGEDYYVIGGYDSGTLRLRWFGKENTSNLLLPRSPLGASLTQEGITRGGGAYSADSDVNTVAWRDLDVFALGLYPWDCSGDNPCTTLTLTQTSNLGSAGGLAWGLNAKITNSAISGSEVTNNCSSRRLRVINTPAPVVSYLWNTGEQTDEIYINAKGAYWCDLELANGCKVRAQTHIREI